MSSNVKTASALWWENLAATERFALMRKYSIDKYSRKAIDRIYRSEKQK